MIHEHLFTGAGKAQTCEMLCLRLNISKKELQRAVNAERLAGIPICASSGKTPGYFLAATREEMQAFCASLRRRAGQIHRTRRACLKTLATLPSAACEEGSGEHGESPQLQDR